MDEDIPIPSRSLTIKDWEEEGKELIFLEVYFRFNVYNYQEVIIPMLGTGAECDNFSPRALSPGGKS